LGQSPKLIGERRVALESFQKESIAMKMPKLGPAALAFAVTFLVPLAAFAADETAKGANKYDVKTWAAIGAGLAIGLGVLGGGLGQGRAAAAALEGISRNPGAAPRIQTPMILGLALIESLVLLSFVIAFFLQGFVTAP
jgi:F-type H+-transporting ATPase subunit c